MEKPFFSIVVPTFNNEAMVCKTTSTIAAHFDENHVSDYEILVVNDHSTDGTEAAVKALSASHERIRFINNVKPQGYGLAVRSGLEHFAGDAVAIVMDDLSDAPGDVLTYYTLLKEGAECVLGTRFVKGAKVEHYPRFKYMINRFANRLIMLMFRIPHNDITNAFKGYRREVIDGLTPIISTKYNVTIELPLKAIVRGYTYETIPVAWRNPGHDVSKGHLREMGSRYLFIFLYVLLEKWLSKGDYRRKEKSARPRED